MWWERDYDEAARDPDSTVIMILHLACQSSRPTDSMRGCRSCAFPLASIPRGHDDHHVVAVKANEVQITDTAHSLPTGEKPNRAKRGSPSNTASIDTMTLQIDDAGVGDLLHGVVVGAYRPETGEFSYDLIDVEFFQSPKFRNKAYLGKASELVIQIMDRMKVQENEPIQICSSFIFEKAVKDLEERYGKERVTVTKIADGAQRFVETAYLDEIRNLGYEPLEEREEKRARSFFHMLRWLKQDPRRFRHAKTGWPRLKKYVKPRRTRKPSSTDGHAYQREK